LGRGLRVGVFSGGLFVFLVEFFGFFWAELTGIPLPGEDDEGDPNANDNGVDNHEDNPGAFFREEGHDGK
jgi:hypothetical protein